MVTETQKRIEAYRELLPGLREKVTAVAFLLALSVIMLTSASFAWLTISRAPEVTAVSTNIASNGSLEIALATGDGKTAPGDSKVGDSSATEGQNIVNANKTWGNLINLSDPSYGLDNLALRPAQLNTAALLTSPLYGADYNNDGRITQLNSSFGYATWNLPDGDKPGYFGVSKDFGVRAISSTKIEAVGADVLYVNMVTKAKNQNLIAANMYVALGNNDKYMPSLATMMGLYMTARMNPDHATLSNPDCAVEDIQNLRDMYAAFLGCFDAEAQAMADVANLTLFLLHGEGEYTPYTVDMIYETTTAKLKVEGIQITDLDQFIKDRNVIASDLEKLNAIAENGTSLKWKDSGLNAIVNNLVNVGACTIGADNTPISSIGASNAMGYLSGTQEARITNGILYRFEERTGGYIEVKNLGISATVNRMGLTIPATVKANIQTTAPRDYNLFTNDLTYAESLNTGDYKGGVAVAEDTYGLAVDFWVRTNSVGSYLTLEGNVLTKSEIVRAMGKDADGKEVELYTVTISGEDENGETVSYSIDVYSGTRTVTNPETGETTEENCWYSAETHTVLGDEDLNGQAPTPKMVEKVTILGYEGENRVWGGNKTISVDATTQGRGSCYVYYADTPEDMERSLKLLEAFNVAFVDEKGSLMATAVMDTEKYYAESGRVTVPLVLSTSESINLGEDYEGNVTYAITALEQNVATRITAIIYLDGTKLGNKDVLSAANIQGQLNIQFGSSESLKPIGNEVLEGKELRVSATVDKTEFDYDTATEAMTSKFTVNVEGDEPQTVTAYLIRQINDTQGSREDSDPDTPAEDPLFFRNVEGKWICDYTFTVPGKYVLRTVNLDGTDYDLKEIPKVTVSGFAISSFSCKEATDNHVNVLTADNSTTVNLSMKFATDNQSKLPKIVQARFLSENGAVNADFTLNPTTGIWSATATFLRSGEYKLQYVVLDGETVELDPGFWHTASITLGMRVAVYTTSPHTFKYVPSTMADNEKLLGMQVMILDNAGNELPGKSGVKLTYGMKGSGVKKMDADLTWDGSYYSGSFPCGGPGIWQFINVTVGENTLTNATTSPTFTILSPEPPEYYNKMTNFYQYAPNNDATMNVQITNSSAAVVEAYIIKDEATNGTWVRGVIGAELTTEDGKPANNWSFTAPTDANGYQDGHWTLTKLHLWNVFAADGTAYTEEEPLEIDVSDTNNVSKVVSRVYVTFEPGQSKNFGTNESGKVTGAFMESHTISGLNVVIKDFEGPLKGVGNVKIDYVYAGDSVAKGGYSGGNVPSSGVTVFNIDMVADASDPTKFAQKGTQAVQIAGTYNPKISFTFDGGSVTYEGDTLPANAPVFTVSSVAPTVKITEASYAGKSSDTAATFTDTSTKVYAYEYTTSTPVCGTTFNYKAYKQPFVTLTLSGYGNAAGATLTFAESTGGTVLLYEAEEGTKAVSTYTWTGNGTCKRWVGYWNSQTGDDDRTKAGTLNATTLVLTYDEKEYSVAAPITINNPN
ncbi:MAG: hypothetical protein IJZ58_09235 [Oscillospiraceae bacterium]|nr:hypothetical protein [Oscillospiraceae bacterium]